MVKYMNTSQTLVGNGHSTGRPWFVWMTYGLLSVWLFLGSVAFAEQVDLLAETSTQDEEALSCFASALLNDDRFLPDGLIGSFTAVPFSLVIADSLALSGLDPLLSSPVLSPPGLRPHQRVSVYRI